MRGIKGIWSFVNEMLPWLCVLFGFIFLFAAFVSLDGVGHQIDNKSIQYALIGIGAILIGIFFRMADFMDLLTMRMKTESSERDKTN